MDDGVIVPEAGIDEEYDRVCEEMQQCKRQLDGFLVEQRKKLRCQVKEGGIGVELMNAGDRLLWHREESISVGDPGRGRARTRRRVRSEIPEEGACLPSFYQ